MSLGLYIHVPFCIKKCAYCDFVSFPRREEAVAAYLTALGQEMAIYMKELAPLRPALDTIFIGGGTPTCLTGDQLAALWQLIDRHFIILPEAEITVEANPGTITKEKLQVLQEAGVNRLSIGVQAAQAHLLRTLGRIHDFGEAKSAVLLAREAGWRNINLDLIFGIPGQTAADWRQSLYQALLLQPEHLACYGLQLEAGTPLWRAVEQGQLDRCDEDLEADMYQETIPVLAGAGYEHYEISNFARPGRQSRHNLRYWLNQEYLGFGPAAHSYLAGCRWANEPDLKAYCRAVAGGLKPIQEMTPLTVQDQMAETAFLGLRLRRGIDRHGFFCRFRVKIEDVYGKQINKLVRQGLVEVTEEYLRLTPRGLMVANDVMAEFV